MGYLFEWDAAKAVINHRKHGVTFDEAMTVFGDPLSLLLPDPDHSNSEARFVVLGISNRRQLLVVAFSERPPRTRIISARKGTKCERRRYEEIT